MPPDVRHVGGFETRPYVDVGGGLRDIDGRL